MIKVGDYLYFYHNYGRNIDRVQIERETKTQWVISMNRKVKKDGLKSIGTSSYSHTYYYEETPELKEKYEVHGVWREILIKLDRMADKRNHYIKDRLTKEKVNKVREKINELHDMLEELL